MEGGVRMLFNNTDELKDYKEQLSLINAETAENEQRNQVISKLNSAFNRALRDEQAVIDSIKAFADVLFSFIFNAEAHRQDKLDIYEEIVRGIRETSNSWELEESIKAATHELGILTYDHRLTFYTYAHNQIDFNYEKIKNRLLKELLILKLGLS